VCLDADGSHAWATSSVWDAEGLVQVQVAHVCTNVARACQADLLRTGSRQNNQHTCQDTTSIALNIL
jgi:hypothetical protein